ncbi:MAG: Sec-independent protein translocase protein TatB [Rhodanobacteraceae bacterium]
MIELSFTKLLLVAIIALIVLGPEKLPKAARMAGAMLRRLRVGWDSVRSEVERELEIEEIRRAAKDAVARAESFQKTATETAQSARKSVNEAVAEVAAATRAARDSVAEVAVATRDAGAREPAKGAEDGDA